MHSWILITVMALCTMMIRFMPFLLFQKKTPEAILYLGNVLPYCAMAMLVVYCLKDVRFNTFSGFLPELIAVVIVVVTYKWKHSTALSILSGTIAYMLLIQNVFIK
ncbi:MAG: AzlD domain-containing protein [Erysipelotrichaceae bacterium]|nr:AzlD domain-containing protein [Erysipelotrichaceae bacterium]